eukprot:c25385_g1_i11 orf=150-2783(+)
MDNFQGTLHFTLFLVSTATCCCFFIIVGTFSPLVSSASSVKIGALLDINSTMGQDISEALQFALQDVNNAQGLLNGTQLELEIVSCRCDPVHGAALAVELMQREVVVVVGPQSSVVAHFVGHIGKAAQVPILSFASTDPNLAEQQYPYFLRVAPSDAIQMEAVAALIAKFGWKVVVAIYTDDDFGANGASALSLSLQKRGSRLQDRSKISSEANATEIRSQLTRLENTESRVFVLHTQQALGLQILSEANNLNMISSGYVWIVTDLVAVGLLRPELKQSLVGLLGIRRYVPPSPPLNNLLTHLKEKHTADIQSVNTYALYAYDAVQAAAHAISSHLAHGGNLTFTEFSKLYEGFVGGSDFKHMKVLQSGPALRESLLETAFLGTSGFIEFDDAGDLKNASFEYINLARESVRVVAYWASGNNISDSPPQLLDNFTLNTNLTDINSTSMNITWPGGGSDIPRGWVLSKNGQHLKIGVPKKADYLQLVNEITDSNNNTRFDGFCIKVFDTAVKNLNYSVTYDFVVVASKVVGKVNPVYDDLINKMLSGELDAAGGDLTITADRLKKVDFTQPYIESGLVVLVARKDKISGNRWAFLRPFTGIMWGTMLGLTMFVGIVVSILERKKNPQFKGPGFMLWFMFSTWLNAHRENTKTFLAHIVLILWLFCVLVLNSSYTASLTTILTVEQLTVDIRGLDMILQSNDPIGYQTGSFVKEYLMGLKVSENRLKDLDSLDSYKNALDLGPDRGGVAAIVDELPYVQIFLASNCKDYAIAGQVFTKSGWGFAFPRGSEIVEDLSTELLRMSQTGELSQLHDYWFKLEQCNDSGGAMVDEQSNQLGIKSFWVLFVIMGTTSIMCVLAFLLLQNTKWRYPPSCTVQALL